MQQLHGDKKTSQEKRPPEIRLDVGGGTAPSDDTTVGIGALVRAWVAQQAATSPTPRLLAETLTIKTIRETAVVPQSAWGINAPIKEDVDMLAIYCKPINGQAVPNSDSQHLQPPSLMVQLDNPSDALSSPGHRMGKRNPCTTLLQLQTKGDKHVMLHGTDAMLLPTNLFTRLVFKLGGAAENRTSSTDSSNIGPWQHQTTTCTWMVKELSLAGRAGKGVAAVMPIANPVYGLESPRKVPGNVTDRMQGWANSTAGMQLLGDTNVTVAEQQKCANRFR